MWNIAAPLLKADRKSRVFLVKPLLTAADALARLQWIAEPDLYLSIYQTIFETLAAEKEVEENVSSDQQRASTAGSSKTGGGSSSRPAPDGGMMTAGVKAQEKWKNIQGILSKAFKSVPAEFQRPLWALRLVGLSKQGKNVVIAMSKMRETQVGGSSWGIDTASYHRDART